jgi:biopolymer transport protein ExbD
MADQSGLRSGRRKRRPVAAIEISLTPLIDTVLVLMITFMVAMPVMQNTLNVELPTGAATDSRPDGKTQTITIYIDRNNKLYVNEKPVRSREDLIRELGKMLSASREEVVYVSADCHVLYETVAQVIDDIKYLGGVRYVALATKNG